MVLDTLLTIVVAFVIVVSGSYVGSRMALNVVFGRDFDPTDLKRSVPADPEHRDTDE